MISSTCKSNNNKVCDKCYKFNTNPLYNTLSDSQDAWNRVQLTQLDKLHSVNCILSGIHSKDNQVLKA